MNSNNEQEEDILNDMKSALDIIFEPLDINCSIIDENINGELILEYEPPYIYDYNWEKWRARILIYNDNLLYPLYCISFLNYNKFIIENPDDWYSKADEYIWWKEETQNLLNKLKK